MTEPIEPGDPETGKALVRRLIDEVMNGRRLDILEEIYTPRMAPRARAWIEPFLESFTDVEMRIVALVAEGDRVAARFTCAGTHIGTWLGNPPTYKRFTNVAEVYFFRVRDGRLAGAWGLEDTWARLGQLGLRA